MSSEPQTPVESETPSPELTKKRETDWLKVLFQIQVNLSALGGLHFLFKDSYWTTILFGKVFYKLYY